MSEGKKEETQKETGPVTLSEAEAEAAVAKAEYEAAKEEAEDAKPDDGTLRSTTISDAVAASELAATAETAYEAAKEKVKAARITSEAAWKAEYEAAKSNAGEITKDEFTHKRKQDRIFRREMGEPEFFGKAKSIALKAVHTQQEEEEISRKVQIPTDQTPKYNPENLLSPEFAGISNYESGLADILDESKLKLERLLNDPNSTVQEIELVKTNLKKLNYLFENFHLGMNVFRTAKGGRDLIKE
jgi:colicin import membrane protein